MTFRDLDQDGDWSFGSGRSDYAIGQKAIALNIRTRLNFWLNDFFSAMNFGIDWRNLIGAKNPEAQSQINVQTRLMLIRSFGVVRINSVNSAMAKRALNVTYHISTIYSRSVRQNVEIGS